MVTLQNYLGSAAAQRLLVQFSGGNNAFGLYDATVDHINRGRNMVKCSMAQRKAKLPVDGADFSSCKAYFL